MLKKIEGIAREYIIHGCGTPFYEIGKAIDRFIDDFYAENDEGDKYDNQRAEESKSKGKPKT